MATTISSRELEENLDRMLTRVEDGESFEITRHGQVIARLLPPERVKMSSEEEQDSLWAELSKKVQGQE